MHCEGKLKLRWQNSSYCLLEVVTKTSLTVYGITEQKNIQHFRCWLHFDRLPPFIYWKWYGSLLFLLWNTDKKQFKHFRGISIPTEFCSNWPDGFEYNDRCKEMTIGHKTLCIRSAKNTHSFISLHVYI